MIAVDIGGSHITSMHIGDVDCGELVGSAINTVVRLAGNSREAVLQAWIKNIEECIGQSSEFDGQLAIAMPGPCDYSNGTILPHPNGKFKALEGEVLSTTMLDRIDKLESVFFINDAQAFGLGEYFYGSDDPPNGLVALTLGTGIGSAFVREGSVVTDGSVPEGGEVYHLPFASGLADDYFSTRWFVRRAKDYGVAVSGVRELLETGEQPLIEAVFDEFVLNFTNFMGPLVDRFGAEMLTIGGNIAKAWPYFGDAVAAFFANRGVTVRKSTLGERGICLGAAKAMLYYNLAK